MKMKAVAMSVDNDENQNRSTALPPIMPNVIVMETRPEYLDAIKRAKQREPHQAAMIEQTQCFVKLWMENGELCPERSRCGLAVQCEDGYKHALVQIDTKHLAPKTQAQVPDLVAQHLPPIKPQKNGNKKMISVPASQAKAAAKAQKAPAKPKKKRRKRSEPSVARGKWRGTGKFNRLGYTSSGRPVDEALKAFLDGLGQPPRLPTVWSPVDFVVKYGHLGRLLISQTASYTRVLIDGRTVCNFWTNAGGCALVDLAEELVNAAKRIPGMPIIDKLGHGQWKGLSQSSIKKAGTCSYRFELTFGGGPQTDILSALGAMIRMLSRPV
jgi:hypothetical protein